VLDVNRTTVARLHISGRYTGSSAPSSAAASSSSVHES
jgi:hypothetical protein